MCEAKDIMEFRSWLLDVLKNKLKPTELAFMIDVDHDEFMKIYSGKKQPSEYVLVGIARVLKLPIDDFYSAAGKMSPGK